MSELHRAPSPNDADPTARFWSNTLFIPAYASALSALILSLQCITALARRRSAKSAKVQEPAAALHSNPPTNGQLAPKSGMRKHINELGGLVIFGWRLARLLACAALLALSVYTVILNPHQARDASEARYFRWLQISLTVVYVRLLPRICVELLKSFVLF